MDKDILTFDDIAIEKKYFYCHKNPIFKRDVDNEKVLLSKNISAEKNYKYFIVRLNNDYKVKPLHIMLLKTNTYVKSYDGQTKLMYFLIKDDDLLKKYTIWGKVSAYIKKIDSEAAYKKKFLKAKIKSYGFPMKLVMIFMIKKFLRWTVIILV